MSANDGYSNIGYWLLGRIVERASGETYAHDVVEHVLRPLEIAPQELGYSIPGLTTWRIWRFRAP